ncbi:alpha-mannosidase [Plakobranchus ocellatus]|uniref:alpha-mannosidase n=1 Tax=Plakobranchus ocellatus TaxID=259542 RepID=A0AAV4BJF1_9GAST|nr:alpha-mannosidase [Plakobranchus ocellatus]
MDHVPFKHKRTTLERAEKFISQHYFTDINLKSRLYREKATVTSIKHFAAKDRIPLDDALQGHFKKTSIGEAFGPVWSTHWFELEINIPASWVEREVHLLWNSGSEALVWIHGEPIQGLSSDNNRISYPLTSRAETSKLHHIVHIEMACNQLLGIGDLAIVKPEHDERTFTLRQAEIAVFDRDVFDLILDIETLHDIAKELPETNQRGFQALFTANAMINQIEVHDRSTFKLAQEMAHKFFTQRNGQSQHTLHAMGHAHIDTAWLWPYDETKRKCARSWTCTLRLMEKYPNFTFMCSQAQQYAWVKELYPGVWKDICKFVHKGQFVPVGGTWVEMDGNIPSGEACIRQFLYGQKFFQEEFGIKCKEFWLPDTFGYSAQFPQILRHCGVSRFLTQKLSWSLVNKFPHHTFYWEGIDGSSVLAHFPPGDDYSMTGKVKELLKTTQSFKEKGRSNHSAFLFGYGDGGHGPSEEMLGRLSRLKDCDGIPKVQLSSSDAFFSTLEAESPNMLCHWRGELYLELHNGTYTTWAQVKKYNRHCEILLQETELLCTLAWVQSLEKRSEGDGYSYPKARLEALWKLLLLNQFHDVLPGSSINMVFHDAIKLYKEIVSSCSGLIDWALRFSQATTTANSHGPDLVPFVINTQPFLRREVIRLPDSDCLRSSPKRRKLSLDLAGAEDDVDMTHVEIEIPALCVKPLSDCTLPPESNTQVTVKREDDLIVLANGKIKVLIDHLGRVTSLACYDAVKHRWSKEAIDPDHPANQFLLYDDVPLYWDAWDVMDYHLETRKPVLLPIQRLRIDEASNPTRVALEVSLQISDKSYLQQKIILEAGSPYVRFDTEVAWHENRKFLKVEFPTTVHTTEAAYDIQSGFLRRPNHFNTSWDSARFEVCGHKWADLSEYGFGVSVLNDCKYGYSAVDGILRLSLLRSPKSPDHKADMGVHIFSYALMPHTGSLQDAGVIQTANAFNCPLRVKELPLLPRSQGSAVGSGVNKSLFEVDTPQVLVQTVKMAEDETPTIIVRLNEAFGGSVQAKLTSRLKFSHVQACDGLEEALHHEDRKIDLQTIISDLGTEMSVQMSAFQIVSLRCCL